MYRGNAPSSLQKDSPPNAIRSNGTDKSTAPEPPVAQLDGADPPDTEVIHTDSPIANKRHNNGNSKSFCPLKYSLPTRLYNPITSIPMNGTPYSAAPTDRVFLASNPTAVQVRIYLDDIEQTGEDYGMSGREMIGMALYYADVESKLLWKSMSGSWKGQDWARFKSHVLWYYPDAFFQGQNFPKVVAFGCPPRVTRDHIVGCLWLLEDSGNVGSTNRQLCMSFGKSLPGTTSWLWKERVEKRVRERYPELKDEFECNLTIFLYYIFLEWKEEWQVQYLKYCG